MKTSLYRHFNKNGDLLYVGVSLSALNRLGQHKEHSHWFESISRVTIEHYKTREEALTAEKNAIKNENPKHNIRNNKEDKNPTRYEMAEKSINELISRVVNYNILYTDHQIAQILFIKINSVRSLIESGQLGGIKTYESLRNVTGKEPFLVRRYAISGWQLIDFIESCQKTGQFPFAKSRTEPLDKRK